MKRYIIIAGCFLAISLSAFASANEEDVLSMPPAGERTTLTWPDDIDDPERVPITESLLGLLGLGGAYAIKFFRKKKETDTQ